MQIVCSRVLVTLKRCSAPTIILKNTKNKSHTLRTSKNQTKKYITKTADNMKIFAEISVIVIFIILQNYLTIGYAVDSDAAVAREAVVDGEFSHFSIAKYCSSGKMLIFY